MNFINKPALVQKLLPQFGFGFSSTKEKALQDVLFPEEQFLIKKEWNSKRKENFIMGRLAAHRAIKKLKRDPFPVLQGEYGQPVWDTKTIGSISHRFELAVAVTGCNNECSGLGIDIELYDEYLSKDDCKQFCLPDEFQLVEMGKISPIVLFSIKESVLKAYYSVGYEDLYVNDFSVLQNRKNVESSVLLMRYNNKLYVMSLTQLKTEFKHK